MSNEPADFLDDVLAGRRAPDADSAALLAALKALEPLRAVPTRAPAAARSGLHTFLNEARGLPTQAATRAVSRPIRPRLTGWKLTRFHKELTPMNIVLTLALAVSLALGGTGATVYAARDSLPNDALYGVKLAAEDLRLNLNSDPPAQLALLGELTHTRTQEMRQLAEAGRAVPAAVTTRLQTQLHTELQLAAALDDSQLTSALAQVQYQTQTQLQIVTQARQAAPADAGLQAAEQALLQTRTFAQLGQASPAQFRTQLHLGPAAPTSAPPATRPPLNTPNAAGYGPGDGDCLDGACPPEYDGNSYGPGSNNPAATPNGAGSGPGDGDCLDGACPPEYDGNSYGPGPNNPAATPNAAGYGPGDGDCLDGACPPEYDGNSYGPGPNNPAATPSGANNAYGPGPVQDTPAPAATPAGDQNSSGPGPIAPAPTSAGDTGGGDPGQNPLATPPAGGQRP